MQAASVLQMAQLWPSQPVGGLHVLLPAVLAGWEAGGEGTGEGEGVAAGGGSAAGCCAGGSTGPAAGAGYGGGWHARAKASCAAAHVAAQHAAQLLWEAALSCFWTPVAAPLLKQDSCFCVNTLPLRPWLIARAPRGPIPHAMATPTLLCPAHLEQDQTGTLPMCTWHSH